MKMFLLFDLVLLMVLCWPLLNACWLFGLCLWSNLICSLLRAQGGKWHANTAFLMCSFSCCSVDWSVQTTLALYSNVLKTLFLTEMKWLLSQRRYWSVCVGFQYTVVFKVLLGPGETRVSKKGNVSSSMGSSMVNWICGSCELVC